MQFRRAGFGARRDQERRDFGPRLAEIAGRVQAHDEQCRGQGVGLFGGRSDDGGAEHLVGRPAGAGIEHVAVALSLKMKKLCSRTRCAQGLAGEAKLGEASFRLERVAEGDGPAAANFGFWIRC